MTTSPTASAPPGPRPGRRALLAGGAAVGAGALVAGTAGPASAAGPATAASYGATPLPTPAELHTLNRLTYGYTPAALAQLRAAGSPQAWFEQQLAPDSIAESADATIDDWWVSIKASPETIVARDADDTEDAWTATHNYARWIMLKRMFTTRQLREVMAEFWENHLYIPLHDDGVHPFRIQFGHTMRELALSSFTELLLASTTHPAMGCSLDNAGSRKSAVNENLGRELLELHTVGQGHYTQDDVLASARMLTGYRVYMWSTWAVTYDTSWHYVGPLKIMDFNHPNTDADGRAATAAYLTYLARHPATAERICRKLARRFVDDEPSPALVAQLANVYLDNDTQIKPVLRALFASDEFWASADGLVRSPTDELAALYRALGVRFAAPTGDSGANSFIWNSDTLGYSPFSWPRPDGPPMRNSGWSNPSRFLGSWAVHWNAANGWWPTVGTTWIAPKDRLPQPSLTVGELIDHLSRTLIGRGATDTLVAACCSVTGRTSTTVVDVNHNFVKYQLPQVMSLILNQPHFYLR